MLTPRLNMILENIEKGKIADIGTDHAYLPIELAKMGKQVIATDVNIGPLKNAEKNVIKNNQNIELRLGSGLAPLNIGDADEIIIAGMGGELIEKIISADFEKALSARLLLQPMNSQKELRKFLIENGFTIIKEDLAKEGFKIYNLIICEKGNMKVPEDEFFLHLPKSLYTHPLFSDLLQKKIREFKKCYDGLSKGTNTDILEIEKAKLLLDKAKSLEEKI